MATKYEGQRFGKLTVLNGFSKPNKSGNSLSFFTVRCDCGNVYSLRTKRVLEGSSTQCNKCRIETRSAKADIGYKHPLYKTWWGMIMRCACPTFTGYDQYGGRGISVCEKWKGKVADGQYCEISGFHSFCEDMGDKQEGATIDRIDVNGNYEPSNCKWSNWLTQSNNRRNNKLVEIDGVILTQAQWFARIGTKGSVVIAAKRYGVTLEQAIKACLYDGYGKRRDWVKLLKATPN